MTKTSKLASLRKLRQKRMLAAKRGWISLGSFRSAVMSKLESLAHDEFNYSPDWEKPNLYYSIVMLSYGLGDSGLSYMMAEAQCVIDLMQAYMERLATVRCHLNSFKGCSNEIRSISKGGGK